MNLVENIREGIKAIFANKLRTILTSLIIAIGITSLVGILTAIDGIQYSINDSFSNLGANTFMIQDKRAERGRSGGKVQKSYPPITFDEVSMFKRKFGNRAITTIKTRVTGNAEVKYGSVVTNPNMRVYGGDINYLYVEGYDIQEGRNISQFEQQNGASVALLGQDVYKALFKNGESPINKKISFLGNKFKIVGLLTEQGSEGGSANRNIIVPLDVARRIAKNRTLRYDLAMTANDPSKLDHLLGEATGLFKTIRKDRPGSDNSFEIRKKQSLAERLSSITIWLQAGGFVIAFVTLLGASIGLMNIMLVSVTERTREIGVRKALGATPLRIRQQFLIESIVITALGGLGGIVLGLVVGNILSQFLAGVFVIPWKWMFVGLLISVVVGLLSGYIPAYKASKLDPIISLRFE